jgi:hypothetical protein
MNDSRISELVHELSFATFRVAAVIDYPFFRKELERAAVDLTSYIDEEATDRLERLVRLGNAIGEISSVNAEVLLRETKNLKELIEDELYEEPAEIDVSGLFSRKENQLPFIRQEETEIDRKSSGNLEPTERQAEIVEFIRQFPDGCRMGDLARNFDDVSKRTLRNDISALIDRRLLERVGGKGPSGSIRAVETGSASVDPIIMLQGPESAS